MEPRVLGSRRQIGEPLLSFAAQLRPDPLACTETDYAEVLEAPIADIRGVLGSTRAALAALLRTLRPFAVLFGGDIAGQRFAPGGGLSTEDDIVRALEDLRPSLPVAPTEALARARQGDVRSLAAALAVDLAALNVVLATMGPPYSPLDFTPQQEETLCA